MSSWSTCHAFLFLHLLRHLPHRFWKEDNYSIRTTVRSDLIGAITRTLNAFSSFLHIQHLPRAGLCAWPRWTGCSVGQADLRRLLLAHSSSSKHLGCRTFLMMFTTQNDSQGICCGLVLTGISLFLTVFCAFSPALCLLCPATLLLHSCSILRPVSLTTSLLPLLLHYTYTNAQPTRMPLC